MWGFCFKNLSTRFLYLAYQLFLFFDFSSNISGSFLVSSFLYSLPLANLSISLHRENDPELRSHCFLSVVCKFPFFLLHATNKCLLLHLGLHQKKKSLKFYSVLFLFWNAPKQSALFFLSQIFYLLRRSCLFRCCHMVATNEQGLLAAGVALALHLSLTKVIIAILLMFYSFTN